MNVVVAAPRARLAVYLGRCDAALGATPHVVTQFAHDESRDPTIDLPHLVFTLRPQALVLVAPRREDPATLDAVRRFGTKVIAWFEPRTADEGKASIARRRWIAAAADAVLASDAESAAQILARNGRPARVVDGDGIVELAAALRP